MLIGWSKRVAKEAKDGEWLEFEGHYEKVEYQILTKGMKIFGPCWPNAGIFHELGGQGRVIDCAEVIAVKEIYSR